MVWDDERNDPITVEMVKERLGLDDEKARIFVALADGEMDPTDLPGVAASVQFCADVDSDDGLLMEAFDELLGGFGVESIEREGRANDFVARYVNMGDTYDVTVVQEEGGQLWITSWGDWLHAFEAEDEEE